MIAICMTKIKSNLVKTHLDLFTSLLLNRALQFHERAINCSTQIKDSIASFSFVNCKKCFSVVTRIKFLQIGKCTIMVVKEFSGNIQ